MPRMYLNFCEDDRFECISAMLKYHSQGRIGLKCTVFYSTAASVLHLIYYREDITTYFTNNQTCVERRCTGRESAELFLKVDSQIESKTCFIWCLSSVLMQLWSKTREQCGCC